MAAWQLFCNEVRQLGHFLQEVHDTDCLDTYKQHTTPSVSDLPFACCVCTSWTVITGIEDAEAVKKTTQQEQPTATASHADKPANRNVSASASGPGAATAVPSAPAAAPAASVSTMHRFLRKVRRSHMQHAWCSPCSKHSFVLFLHANYEILQSNNLVTLEAQLCPASALITSIADFVVHTPVLHQVHAKGQRLCATSQHMHAGFRKPCEEEHLHNSPCPSCFSQAKAQQPGGCGPVHVSTAAAQSTYQQCCNHRCRQPR